MNLLEIENIEEKCVKNVLGLKHNKFNSERIEEINEQCFDVCLDSIKEKVETSEYSNFVSEIKKENGKISVELDEHEIGVYCVQETTEKECYKTPLPEEITKHLDEGYSTCFGNQDENEIESEEVSEVQACQESMKIFIEAKLQKIAEKTLEEQVDYVKENTNNFIANG